MAETRRKKSPEVDFLQKTVEISQAALNENLKVFDKAGENHSFPASMFQTYAFAITLLAAGSAPESATQQFWKLAKGLKDAATVPYFPVYGQFDSSPRPARLLFFSRRFG